MVRVDVRTGRERAWASGGASSDRGALGDSGECAVPFVEVDFDQVGRVDGPHYYRANAFVMWVDGPTIAGAFPTAPQQLDDLPPARALFARLYQRPSQRLLHSDVRGFGGDRRMFDALLAGAAAQAAIAMPARTAVLLPTDWSRAWWIGAAAMRLIADTPIRAFPDSPSAWAWLGAPADRLPAVQQLTASFETVANLSHALLAHLQTDPTLTLERAARLLGVSPRSVQRLLQTSGESFAQLRDRARAELAAARLAHSDDKIDAVASDTGFRSRSHFVTWFRRLTGTTPTAFRAHHRRR